MFTVLAYSEASAEVGLKCSSCNSCNSCLDVMDGVEELKKLAHRRTVIVVHWAIVWGYLQRDINHIEESVSEGKCRYPMGEE